MSCSRLQVECLQAVPGQDRFDRPRPIQGRNRRVEAVSRLTPRKQEDAHLGPGQVSLSDQMQYPEPPLWHLCPTNGIPRCNHVRIVAFRG